MDAKLKLLLEGLDCANCAGKIENIVNNFDEVKEASINFSFKLLIISYDEEKITEKKLIDKVTKVVNELEPQVKVMKYKIASNKKSNNDSKSKVKLTLEGLDCAHCAGKIEEKVNNLSNVDSASLNFPMKLLIINYDKDKASEDNIIKSAKDIVNDLEPGVKVNKYKDNVSKTNTSKVTEKENKIIQVIKENYGLFAGTIFFILAMALDKNVWLFLISYILVGKGVLLTAFNNIRKGKVFDENFLMSVATIGAFAVGEYPEGVAVMIFYEIGELFQSYAVNRSRKSISALMDIKAEYANLITNTGEIKEVNPEDVKVNDIILIKSGERVPLDGEIIEGSTSVDSSALTGESLPVSKKPKDELLAGSINLGGVIKVKVLKEFEDSTVARILELVQNASSKKAETEKFITKFAKYYTPIVVFSALALAIIPPLVIPNTTFDEWIYRALIFLVVSCPCALVVSVPLGLFAGIGGASKKGILIKGGNYLEALKDVDTVVFDKTGTLTKGTFKVTKIVSDNLSKSEVLRYAALGEQYSTHPIGTSILEEFKLSSKEEIGKVKIDKHEEVSGKGIVYYIDSKEVLVGNSKLMAIKNVKTPEILELGTIIHVALDSKYIGSIVISDQIKENSKEAIEELKALGIKNVVMLTGDNKNTAEKVSKELGIDNVYAELLPQDKVTKIEELLEGENKGKVAFVGDGINDAPVLARADVGVAMGGIGSDAAIEAADVVLMKDEPTALPESIKIARKTSKILWQNIYFSLGVKLIVLVLATLGDANMWEAVFADVGVTLIAVLNSMRALK
ncbi:heavy metal translocating P-type ATPase [Clostridium chrysemydis]|uniref:heavy metal translocating P-type ATPase n=1 Tax=Clostridium chrysemydis TaxID=2665504 RepID=UPI0018838E5C|nr:heavy metal translocating P-type ATPase [Clostridium chrysemydis]